jgi:glycosyltransferase involved in cell wall biosynthesis
MTMNSSKKPLLSIVVPVFNSAAYLFNCIDSIRAQTFKDFECILVDDGSTDDTFSLCENYARLDPRIKVRHQNNSGVSSARNLGLRNCAGDYIAFVDSDDTVLPEMYQVMYTTIAAKDYDVVCCGFRHKNSLFTENIKITGLSQAETVFRLENAGLFGTVWNKLYKREIIEKNRILFSEGYSFGEDFLFNLTYFSFITSALCLDDVLYQYNINEQSISKNRPGLTQSLHRFRSVTKQIIQLREPPGRRFHNRILALDFTYTIFLIRNLYTVHGQYKRFAFLSEIKSFYQTNTAFYSFRSFRYRFFYLFLMYTPLPLFDALCFLFFHLSFLKRKYV